MFTETVLLIVAALAALLFVALLGSATGGAMLDLLLALLVLVFTVALAGFGLLRQVRLLRRDLLDKPAQSAE